MVFRFLFGYFRTFLQTLLKFSEGVFGPIHSDDGLLWKEVLGRRIGALHILRRIFFPLSKEILRLDKGSFDLDLRSLREKRKALREGRRASPSERGGSRRENLEEFAELSLFGRNVIRDS